MTRPSPNQEDPRRPVTAHRAAELVRDEAARLDEGLQIAVAALSAIGDRVRALSRDSARVRALGLECLPHADYLSHCVTALRTETGSARSSRRSRRAVSARVEEIRAMLDRAIELLATIDIPGELELPLELVSTAQSSARAGLASLRRVEDALDSVEITHRADGAGHAGAPRPVPPAQWLVYWASRLLPVGSRERYGEEFRGELRELADAGEGARAQLAYALRQLARIGALRRALPPTPRPAESDRVRAHPLADDAPAPRLRTRKSVDQRRAHRRVRVVVREEPQPPPPYFERRPSPNQDDDVRRNGRHRRRR